MVGVAASLQLPVESNCQVQLRVARLAKLHGTQSASHTNQGDSCAASDSQQPYLVQWRTAVLPAAPCMPRFSVATKAWFYGSPPAQGCWRAKADSVSCHTLPCSSQA